ncbi:MAG TPA: hypothetical protein VMU42_14275 [Candidatus Sulfotelmatobacter sp.]|nr:hypothetical protein [Candidatus Sulfotelmatobacter sp.]
MVPLGGRPILWHLMKYYAHFGHRDFIICLGHKAQAIKQFFVNYQEWVSNDFVLSDGGRRIELLARDIEDWRITLVDTGITATIGERLLAVRPFLRGEEMFMANYADGLTDCPLPAIVDQLERTGAVGVCMVVRPNISIHTVRYTAKGVVTDILDSEHAGSWTNAGFFAFRQEIFDYMRPGEELVGQAFQRLIADGRLAALPYPGFWRCCDTFKDLQILEQLLAGDRPPWQLWRRAPQPIESPSEAPAALEAEQDWAEVPDAVCAA